MCLIGQRPLPLRCVSACRTTASVIFHLIIADFVLHQLNEHSTPTMSS